jgi:hypothetical protein
METIYNISWTIDRNPDYNILNNILNDNSVNNNIINNTRNIIYIYDNIFQDNQEETEEFIPFASYNTNINQQAEETEEFIPFTNNNHSYDIKVEFQVFTVTEEDTNCCVCFETRETLQICQLNCSHKFCSECSITHISKNKNNPCCPLCRKNITKIAVQTDDIFQQFKNI